MTASNYDLMKRAELEASDDDDVFSSASYDELQAMLGTRSREEPPFEYREILHSQIDPDPENARPKNHPSLSKLSIAKLAGTIHSLGLLENLIVVATENDRYMIKGGERRWRAIGVLIDDGRWDPEKKMLCKVVPEGSFEHIAENEREDVPPWRIGSRYIDMVERGFTQEEIARRVGMSQQSVSVCIQVARGLSPKVVEVLTRLGKSVPNIVVIQKIAALRDVNTGAPDEAAQIRALEASLTKAPKRRAGSGGTRVHGVLGRLQQLSKVRGAMRPVLQAVVRYLSGIDEVLRIPEVMLVTGDVPRANAPLPKSQQRLFSKPKRAAQTKKQKAKR